MNKKICLKCKKENDNINVLCECGSQYFISGDNFNITDNEIICGCSGDFNDKGEVIENCRDLIITEHKCKLCNNKIHLEKNIGALTNILKIIKE
jgi:hypothetical protein